MQRPIVLKYWRIIRYKTLIIQTDFKCIDRVDGLRVRYIKVDYRVYVDRI